MQLGAHPKKVVVVVMVVVVVTVVVSCGWCGCCGCSGCIVSGCCGCCGCSVVVDVVVVVVLLLLVVVIVVVAGLHHSSVSFDSKTHCEMFYHTNDVSVPRSVILPPFTIGSYTILAVNIKLILHCCLRQRLV